MKYKERNEKEKKEIAKQLMKSFIIKEINSSEWWREEDGLE